MLDLFHAINLIKKNQHETRKKIQKDLQPVVESSMQQLQSLPLLFSCEQEDLQQKIEKSSINQPKEEADKTESNKKMNDVAYPGNYFAQGRFDSQIFTANPKMNDELQVLIAEYNREFIQRLFFKCQSISQLQFWLCQTSVELPRDSVPLAIALGCNLFVLQHLKEQGWFENLSKEDKKELLNRSKKFENTPGFSYLLRECELQSNSTSASKVT